MKKVKNRYRTTARHFEIFKREAELWIGRLELHGWRIEISHKKDLPDTLASMRSDIPGRVATINLSTDWSGDDISALLLRMTAFHEVFELLLSRMSYLAECRFLSDEEVPEERHDIIRKFENLFYGNGKEKSSKKVQAFTG